MSMQDPIADMLTRIRNAQTASKMKVSMPASVTKAAIATVLKDEGYVKSFKVDEEGGKKTLTIKLKYFQGEPVIEEVKRVSTPGCRVYSHVEGLPQVYGGLGTAIISTSKGMMTGKAAKAAGIGGEVVCTVF